jgi:hypothetical protein
MLVRIREHQVLDKLKPQIVEMIGKFKEKTGIKRSPEETYNYILANIYNEGLAFYAVIDGGTLRGYAIISISGNYFCGKTAFVVQTWNTLGNMRQQFKELEKSLAGLGVTEMSFITKRNEKAFNRVLKDLEYEGKYFTKKISGG